MDDGDNNDSHDRHHTISGMTLTTAIITTVQQAVRYQCYWAASAATATDDIGDYDWWSQWDGDDDAAARASAATNVVDNYEQGASGTAMMLTQQPVLPW